MGQSKSYHRRLSCCGERTPNFHLERSIVDDGLHGSDFETFPASRLGTLTPIPSRFL